MITIDCEILIHSSNFQLVKDTIIKTIRTIRISQKCAQTQQLIFWKSDKSGEVNSNISFDKTGTLRSKTVHYVNY